MTNVHILLRASEHNRGLLGPGDWEKKVWTVYTDGSFRLAVSYRPADLPEEDEIKVGAIRSDSFERLVELLYTKLDNKCHLSVIKKSHDRSSGRKCVNENLVRRSLGYRFQTDVFQLRFINPEITEMNAALSLLYGIMRGICSQLNIEQDDISGCVQYFRNEETGHGAFALIYYDRTPGGAGHVKRLEDPDLLEASLLETLKLMKRCDCGGAEMDTSCYGCLRTYYNQKYHDVLERRHVVKFLEEILGNGRTRGRNMNTEDPASTIRPAEKKPEEEPKELRLSVIQEGMNLNIQAWEDIWEYMLDEDPEPAEEEFYNYLRDNADMLEGLEKPLKGDNQLKDKQKTASKPVSCNMMWKQKKILLFTSENEEDYQRALCSEWKCVSAMDGEDGARKLIEMLKE